MAAQVGITVNIEKFVSGPATEVSKLNTMCDGITELQQAVEQLQRQQGQNGGLTPVVVTGCLNGAFASGIAAYFTAPS